MGKMHWNRREIPILPRTGYTTEQESGDDGTHQAGRPEERFEARGDGTVYDRHTGLFFVRDVPKLGGAFGDGANTPSKMDWSTAVSECDALTFAGRSDWRLPNAHELASLHDFGRTNPCIDPVFLNIQNDYYWSSTSYASPASAYRISFSICYRLATGKSSTYYVLPVRGGSLNG